MALSVNQLATTKCNPMTGPGRQIQQWRQARFLHIRQIRDKFKRATPDQKEEIEAYVRKIEPGEKELQPKACNKSTAKHSIDTDEVEAVSKAAAQAATRTLSDTNRLAAALASRPTPSRASKTSRATTVRSSELGGGGRRTPTRQASNARSATTDENRRRTNVNQ